MRRTLSAVLMSSLIVVLGACGVVTMSTAISGGEAKVHAEKFGFVVIGVDKKSVVVKIGERCHAEFEHASGSAGEFDSVNNVFLDGRLIWSTRGGDDAENPDQFKKYSETASCYDK